MKEEKKEESKKEFEGKKIWESIKSKEIQMFNLPGQTVDKYCTAIAFTDTEALVKAKAGAVLTALEENFKDLTFEPSTDGVYISIKKKEKKESVKNAV